MGAKGAGWQLEKCREDRMGAHTLALPLPSHMCPERTGLNISRRKPEDLDANCQKRSQLVGVFLGRYLKKGSHELHPPGNSLGALA